MGVRWARAALALLAACALALSASACGSGGNGDVTLTIGARGTPEEEVLGHIYAAALRGAGYEVKGDFGLDTEFREVPLEELQAGRISGYPEHLDGALADFFSAEETDLPSDPRDAYEMVQKRLKYDHLTAFPPTPYSLSRPVALLRKTAEKDDVKTVSDLKGVAEKMTLSGFPDCHLSLDCLGGIERYYGISFESISYTYTPTQLHDRFRVLEDGDFDASIVFSTDGRLAGDKGKFVMLEDDKHAFAAGNAVFLTSPKVVDEAGPDFEKTIVAAQKGMTLPVMQQLDAEVELEGKDPAKVAAAYLKRVGLSG